MSESATAPARLVLAVCASRRPTSTNRIVLDRATSRASALGLGVTSFDTLHLLPQFDPDAADDTSAGLRPWRMAVAAADALLLASPEYAGSAPGTLKNALDWLVGSADLYGKPVVVLSAGTTGGPYAIEELVRTLTWQGAHVVAHLGVSGPLTKVGADGVLHDAGTASAIDAAVDTLAGVWSLPIDDRLALVHAAVLAAGVDPAHVSPVRAP